MKKERTKLITMLLILIAAAGLIAGTKPRTYYDVQPRTVQEDGE